MGEINNKIIEAMDTGLAEPEDIFTGAYDVFIGQQTIDDTVNNIKNDLLLSKFRTQKALIEITIANLERDVEKLKGLYSFLNELEGLCLKQ